MPDDFDEIERRFGKAPAAPVADDFDAIEARFAAPNVNVAKAAIDADTPMDFETKREILRRVTKATVSPSGTDLFSDDVANPRYRHQIDVDFAKVIPGATSKAHGDALLREIPTEDFTSKPPVRSGNDSPMFKPPPKSSFVDVATTLAKRAAHGVTSPPAFLGDLLLGKEGAEQLRSEHTFAPGSGVGLSPEREAVARAAIERSGIGRAANMAIDLGTAIPAFKALGRGLTAAGAGPMLTSSGTMAVHGGLTGGGEGFGSGAIFGALAHGIEMPLSKWIDRLPAALKGTVVERLSNAGAGGTSFAAADAVMNGVDAERAIAQFGFGGLLGWTKAVARVEATPETPLPVVAAIGHARLTEAEYAKAAAREAAVRPEAEPTPGEPIDVTIERGQNRLSAQAAPEAPAGFSADMFHGSPVTDLRSVRANPESRQYDNAASQLGAFFAPSEAEASRYSGKGGRIYPARVNLQRPYEMPWSEFNKFQSPDKGPDGKTIADFSESGLARRTQELKSEASSLRKQLEAEGYDGIVVKSARGKLLEVASFKDVALPEAPAAPREEVIQPKAEEPAPKVETPEDVARELDKPTNAPKRKVGISAEAGFADPSMLTDPLKAAGAAASRGLDWTRGTMAPRIQEMAPTAREEIGNLVSRNSGASTDALGVLIKKGVEKYGIDPARMGAAINEGQLRGVREKFKSQQAEATATIERVRSEIEDARKNLADEASAYAEARVKRADDAARHDQFRAEYVAVKTAERAKDSIGASAKERDAALADAREKYADAVASTKADLPRDAEPGERAAVDDSLKTLRAEYDAVVKEIRQTHETVVREALADVRRAKADAARVDDSALSRVEKEKIRADYEADRIRREGMKKRPMRELYSELAKADTAHWNAMLAESRVQSKIGEGKPFATEAEYDAFLKDPKNKGFIDDVVRYVRKVHERDYRDQQTYASAEDAPIRDTRLGIHSNLIPAGPHGFERYGGEAPAEGVEIPRHSAAGRPSALRVRKSPFAREAMGSGTYSDNIVDILMRPLSAQGANAAKHRLARALVADGVAVAIRPGRGEVAPKEIAGFPAKEVPEFEVAALGGRENRRLYVAEPIYQDIRNITKADATLQSPAVMKAINAISVISTVSDSVAMIGNSTFGLVGKMGTSGKPLDVEIFRKATGLRNLKDVFANLGKRVGRITTLDDAKALFEVAEIGGSRDFSRHRIDDGSINPFAWIGHFSSKLNASARVIMSEAYDRMYPEGNPHRSNAAKAEFINRAMGQYQTPGMDRLTRTLRQWGFSPFVSAGKATASRGLDVVSGNPGVWYRDAGVKMKSAAVANTLATLAGVAGASALGTYLATGSFDKPKGVGHLDVWTGEYDKATGRPLVIPLGRYMAVTTGAQMLGVDALVDNLRQGKTLEVAIDAAAKQAVGRIARLMAGPVPNAAAVVMFGHGATSDMPLAEPAFSGNESQMARNVGAAVDSFAPTWRLLWGMAGGVNKAVGGTDFAPDVSVTKEALKQLSYLANITRPSDSEIESANDRIDWYRGSEAVGYVKRKLSTMDPEDRAAYVESVLPRFSDEFRPTAAKALRGSLAKLRARQVASGGK